ncbi:MAG TPA: hypothetical protein VFA45_12190 [Actinomycetes bacterium]|nr:hypothetical protein [Actinomycetes bacterium]
MPWSALLAVGAAEAIAGNRRLVASRDGGSRPGSARSFPPWRATAVGLAAVSLAAVLVASWAPSLRQMTSVREEPPLRAATEWVADNVPRNQVLIVHDSIWTDLVHHYGFNPRPIIVYKLDTDPAVRKLLKRPDNPIIPDWYYTTPAAATKYPTVLEARKHAVVVARFGSGDDGVRVCRISRYWRPGSP